MYSDYVTETAKETTRMAARRAALTKYYKEVNPEKVRVKRDHIIVNDIFDLIIL
jgi:ribosomal protein S15P/S13E